MNNPVFICSKCDSQTAKWAGRCLECGAWGTIKEGVSVQKKFERKGAKFCAAAFNAPSAVFDLKNIALEKFISKRRTGMAGFDSVLGGGIMPGAVVLLGGDPGVGKSTLALQISSVFQGNVLYVSAEESASQTAERFKRLDASEKQGANNLNFINEDSVEAIIATIQKHRPDLAVIDSVQTIFSEEIKSQTGSLNQVKATAAKLIEIAKAENISLLLIGHVTKEGDLAGPKTLEHLVDAVLYLEGDRYKQYRLLRASKNRFGPTDEVAILEMTRSGLRAVLNPSQIFLPDKNRCAGSIICAVAEGSQLFLVEVQSLVSKSAFGYPKRACSGFDQKRLELLTTVITKKAGINLGNFDVYVNIAGGLALREPALDLAVAAGIISSFFDKVLPEKTVVFGEVGLSGEIRPVVKTKERVKEALRLGFKKIILPSFSGADSANLIKVKDINGVIKLLS